MSSKLTITFTMVILTLLLIVSCAPSKLTPATTSETPIPADYTTYTSEGLFSISYPPDWEPALSVMGELEQLTKELITSIESDLPVENYALVFLGGVPTIEGYLPNVNIGVESMPVAIWTLDSVVEAQIEGFKAVAEDYNEFSRVKTTVGGREAVIIDLQASLPTTGTFHYLMMITLVGKTVWAITCTTSPEMFSDYEDDFHAIVRSLRILN